MTKFMRKLPPLNALKAFEASARLSSVTAAAEELGVSHSAVSQQISQLEAYFGQQLFARPGRRVEPTPAALALLEDVRSALDRLAIASEQLTRRGSNRILTINATVSFTQRWLIQRIVTFQDRCPNIEVRVSASASDGIGHLDIPFDFIVRREPMERPGYQCRKLADDSVTPLISPSLLAKYPQLARPEGLISLKLLHMSSRPDAWKRWLTAHGVPVQDTLDGPFFDHFFLSLEAASWGMGAALAPLTLVRDDLAAGRLVAPFADQTLDGPGFHLLYRTEIETDRSGQKFLQWLTAKPKNVSTQHALCEI